MFEQKARKKQKLKTKSNHAGVMSMISFDNENNVIFNKECKHNAILSE